MLVGLGLASFSASAVTKPFAADPYPTDEVTTPEAPSTTPVTEPGVNPANPMLM